MRYSYPEDEEKYDWLQVLLDAYNILDRSVSFDLNKERENGAKKLPVKRGVLNAA